jgi:hypothetical protein
LTLLRALGNDPLLLGAGLLELGLPLLDLFAESTDLADDPGVLVREPVDGIDAVEQIVEARCPEQDLQRGLLP